MAPRQGCSAAPPAGSPADSRRLHLGHAQTLGLQEQHGGHEHGRRHGSQHEAARTGAGAGAQTHTHTHRIKS